MIITIHQPEFMPYMGFFNKMSKADIMVILDTVQYRKDYFQNRNRIMVNNQEQWLTMPIKNHKHDTLIEDIKINWNAGYKDVANKHLGLICSYDKTKYFDSIYPYIVDVYNNKPDKLVDFNMAMIRIFANYLGITTKIFRASSLVLPDTDNKTNKLLDICKFFDADKYLSGVSGEDYLEIDKFTDGDIVVLVNKYTPPNNLSVLDWVCRYGKERELK